MEQSFNGNKILSLLKELDREITKPCRIVICGGAAAIIGYGLKRLTGDIDILEPSPKSQEFYQSVKVLLEKKGLDPKSINDGAKGFVDYLSPDYRKRVISLNAGFKHLQVSIINKADFITMKICAWRESDMQDVKSVGITKEDLTIINENLSYIAKHSPDKAQKAHLVLAEIGVHSTPRLKIEEVNSLSELILFYRENTGMDASLEVMRLWKKDISSGIKPSFIAKRFEGKTKPFVEMDPLL